MTAKDLTERDFWMKVLDRYGFPTLVALALMFGGWKIGWFVAEGHVRFLDATIQTQQRMAATQEQQVEIATKQASGQAALVDMTDESASVLRSIKDDTTAIRQRVSQ